MRVPDCQALIARLAEARALTDELFAVVRPEAFYDRPIPERHRIIFYLGHLEAFDWNLLGRDVFGQASLHPAFDRLFAFGIDPLDGQLPSDTPSDWPMRAEVERHNQRLRQTLDALLEAASLNGSAPPLVQDGFLLHLVIEHRLMHAETLAYMLHQLPLERKSARANPPSPATPPATPRMVEIPAGRATLGLPRRACPPLDGVFGWDNEFEEHVVEVPAFTMDVHNVTNGEYLKFVEAGGYAHRALWAETDWEWKEARGLGHPPFWVQRGGEWFCRAMFANLPLPLDWPVYASHAEASAYLRWCGKSLPTEAEFHRAAYGTRGSAERAYPWGSEPPNARHGNFDFRRWDPVAVGAHPAGNSAFGVADLAGNGWEWTGTVFGAFSGFQKFPFYPGYSANFFDGQHYVVKGASPRTAAGLLRRTFRNWFQGHYPYIYGAFRGVKR